MNAPVYAICVRRSKVRIKASFITVFILISFFKPCYSQEEEQLSLTLEECIIRALRDNLSVAVEVINPEIADVSLTKAKETFMPRLDIGFGNERIDRKIPFANPDTSKAPGTARGTENNNPKPGSGCLIIKTTRRAITQTQRMAASKTVLKIPSRFESPGLFLSRSFIVPPIPSSVRQNPSEDYPQSIYLRIPISGYPSIPPK